MYNYAMRPETLSIMCNPYTREQFDLKNNRLIDVKTGQTFSIRNGIPVILAKESLEGRNRFSRWLYDVFAFLYDPINTLGDALKVNTEGIIRRENISNLNINPGDKVLIEKYMTYVKDSLPKIVLMPENSSTIERKDLLPLEEEFNRKFSVMVL